MNNAVCAFHRINVLSETPGTEPFGIFATTSFVTRSGLKVKAAGRRSDTKLQGPSGAPTTEAWSTM